MMSRLSRCADMQIYFKNIIHLHICTSAQSAQSAHLIKASTFFLSTLFLFNSCVLFVKSPDKKYKVYVVWSSVNLSQSGSGSALCRGRSDYYTNSDERDEYNRKCRKDFEKTLESYGGFEFVPESQAEVRIVVSNFHISE